MIIEKKVMFLGEGPTDGFDDTAITAETEYSDNISSDLHYNAASSFLYANGVQIHQM